MPATLRALKPSVPHVSVEVAAESESRVDLLRSMRRIVARAVDDPETPPRDLAALTRRLMDIAREIEAIESGEEGDLNAGPDPDEEWDPEAI